MPKICIKCVKEAHLKRLIDTDGIKDVCSLCGKITISIDSENERFIQLAKALVRYHYSEWDYNIHWGGNGYESLFYDDDNIFFEQAINEEAYESIVLNITESPVYEAYDEGVSIFAGYTDGEQNMLLQSIKTDLDSGLLKISERLKTENYFHFEGEIKNILKVYSEVAENILPETQLLYRARVGYEEKKRNTSLGFEMEDNYTPYTGKDIAAPPPNLASNGRVNRTGVSFLYCATDKYTAISEVRPHPGDRVSLCILSLSQSVKIFDLSDSGLMNFFENDKKLDEYKIFNTLGQLLNKTIAPSERLHYNITQLIADCIRQMNFDGILFSSTVGGGKNLVLFDQSIAVQVTGKGEVVVIGNVKYEYQQEILVNDNDCYE